MNPSKTYLISKKNFKFGIKTVNGNIFKSNENPNIKINEIKNENEIKVNNEHMQNIINENKEPNNTKESYGYVNKLKSKFNYEYKSTHTIKYVIIYILLCLCCNITSQINLRKNRMNK